MTLPLCPPEAVPIGNSCFAVLISDDTFTYFSNLVPFDSHPADDRAAMLMRIGRLAVISALSPQDLADAFCVSRSTVQRARRRYLAGGEAAFLKAHFVKRRLPDCRQQRGTLVPRRHGLIRQHFRGLMTLPMRRPRQLQGKRPIS